MEREGGSEALAVNDAIDRLQALHCESVIEPEDYEAIQLVVGELLDMRHALRRSRDIKQVAERKEVPR
jgi:hypothetical protein